MRLPSGIDPSTTSLVVGELLESRRRIFELLQLEGMSGSDELLASNQFVRASGAAIAFFEALLSDEVRAWNLRGRAMLETLVSLVRHVRGPLDNGHAKVVVWGHNENIGDARATSASLHGEKSLGQFVRERFGRDSALIGLLTYTGALSAVTEWGAGPRVLPLSPAMADSYEALLRAVRIPNFSSICVTQKWQISWRSLVWSEPSAQFTVRQPSVSATTLRLGLHVNSTSFCISTRPAQACRSRAILAENTRKGSHTRPRRRAGERPPTASSGARSGDSTRSLTMDTTKSREGSAMRVLIPVDEERNLDGELVLPSKPLGMVLFAHGSGSGRYSPRNLAVARRLQSHALGTLLFDLLTPEEERIDRVTTDLRFDIELLASRLERAALWLASQGELPPVPFGYFGASTGAAAALVAAAVQPRLVSAIVSRGGRPDLAGQALPRVCAPTLLIVGSNDSHVLALNRAALQELRCERRLEVVFGATHLFEEPGALDAVADLASAWFATYLRKPEVAETGPRLRNHFLSHDTTVVEET